MLKTTLTFFLLLLAVQKTDSISTERAENFIRALAAGIGQPAEFHHPEELALSSRLWIIYENVPHKFMPGYDLSDKQKSDILGSDSNWSVVVENETDN